MSCLAPGRIAEAATTASDDGHLGECLPCRRLVNEQREMRQLLEGLPAVTVPLARRRESAAAVLAAADRFPPRRPGRVIIATAACLSAAAASLALWLGVPDPAATTVASPSVELREEAANPVREIAMVEPTALPMAQVDVGRAPAVWSVVANHDVVAVSDGVITVDSRGARDIEVRVAEAHVRVEAASVRVHVHRGVILSVQVFAGSAEVVTAAKQVHVDAETIWLATPSTAASSVEAFRAGWIALRRGDHQAAIRSFDRAVDPVVAEDAAYWAAIAARRAGLEDIAAQRFTAFLRRFPSSARAIQAEQYLAH